MCSTQSSPIGPAFCLHPFANVSSEFTGSSRKLRSYRLSFLGYKPKASFTTAGSAAAANRAGQRAQGKKRQCGQYRDLGWAAGRKEQARIDSCSIASVPTKSAAPDGDGNAPPPAAQRSVLDFRRVWPLPHPACLPLSMDALQPHCSSVNARVDTARAHMLYRSSSLSCDPS